MIKFILGRKKSSDLRFGFFGGGDPKKKIFSSDFWGVWCDPSDLTPPKSRHRDPKNHLLHLGYPKKNFFSSVLPPPKFSFPSSEDFDIGPSKIVSEIRRIWNAPTISVVGADYLILPVPRPLYLSGFRPTISAPMPTISVAIGQLSQCLGQLSQLQRHLSQCQNQKANNISEKDPGPASLRQSLQPAWRNSSMLSQNFVTETV